MGIILISMSNANTTRPSVADQQRRAILDAMQAKDISVLSLANAAHCDRGWLTNFLKGHDGVTLAFIDRLWDTIDNKF